MIRRLTAELYHHGLSDAQRKAMDKWLKRHGLGTDCECLESNPKNGTVTCMVYERNEEGNRFRRPDSGEPARKIVVITTEDRPWELW